MKQIRGDTRKYYFQRKNADGEVITSRPDSLYFTVKKDYRAEDFLIQKTLDDMILDDDGTCDGGVVLKSPGGTRYKITVDNSGNLTTTAV